MLLFDPQAMMPPELLAAEEVENARFCTFAAGFAYGAESPIRPLCIVNTFAGVSKPDGQEMTLGFIPFMPIPLEYEVRRDSMAQEAEAERLRSINDH